MAARAAMMAGNAHTVLMSGTSSELFTYRGVTEMPSMQPIGLAAGGKNVTGRGLLAGEDTVLLLADADAELSGGAVDISGVARFATTEVKMNKLIKQLCNEDAKTILINISNSLKYLVQHVRNIYKQ